jgi:hypothetical protein
LVVTVDLPTVFAIFVAHDSELEIDRLDAVELRCSIRHALLDFCLERAARNCEGYENANDAILHNRDTTQHAEVDD